MSHGAYVKSTHTHKHTHTHTYKHAHAHAHAHADIVPRCEELDSVTFVDRLFLLCLVLFFVFRCVSVWNLRLNVVC